METPTPEPKLPSIPPPSEVSQFDRVIALEPTQRREFLREFSAEDLRNIDYAFRFKARPSQQPRPQSRKLLYCCGRGWGKTWTGANTVREWAERHKDIRHIGLVAPTGPTARQLMVEGVSGILAVTPPEMRPIVQPGKRRLVWPNGTTATWFSSERPAQLRGPELDAIWFEELAHFKHLKDTFDNAQFALRGNKFPRWIATTTPLPLPTIRDLVEDPRVDVVYGSTFDNQARLSEVYYELIQKYDGTRLGQQEIYGQLLLDTPGALWTQAMIEASKIDAIELPTMTEVVIGVDPAVTSKDRSDETGIVAAGIDQYGLGYVLNDYSLKATPNGWAKAVVRAFYKEKANFVVAEANQGGDLVRENIWAVDPAIPVRMVHAMRGKVRRAEPVSAFYERDMVKHVRERKLHDLEDQMLLFTPDAKFNKSPDRADAMVWALWALLIDKTRSAGSF